MGSAEKPLKGSPQDLLQGLGLGPWEGLGGQWEQRRGPWSCVHLSVRVGGCPGQSRRLGEVGGRASQRGSVRKGGRKGLGRLESLHEDPLPQKQCIENCVPHRGDRLWCLEVKERVRGLRRSSTPFPTP